MTTPPEYPNQPGQPEQPDEGSTQPLESHPGEFAAPGQPTEPFTAASYPPPQPTTPMAPPTDPYATQPGGYGQPPQPPYGAPQPPYGAGYGAPTGYGAPQAQYGQPPEKTDGVSIAALVTAFLVFWFPIVPIVLGIMGIRRTGPGKLKGRGMALAGLIIGGLSLLGIIVAIVLFYAIWNSDAGREVRTGIDTAISEEVAQCRNGVMSACDTAYFMPGISGADRRVADTCNGTQPAGSGGRCVTLKLSSGLPTPSDPPSPTPSEEPSATESPDISDESGMAQLIRSEIDKALPKSVKDALADPATRPAMLNESIKSCNGGDMAACDFLGYAAKKSEKRAYQIAETCGGKFPEGDKILLCQLSSKE